MSIKGSKRAKNLDRRRADYSRMIASSKAPAGSLHRPGSNKK